MIDLTSPPVNLRSGTPGETRTGVIEIDGRKVVGFSVYSDDSLHSLSHADGETLAQACTMALAQRLPLVGWIASSGADIREGIPASHGWGTIARGFVQLSGVVPTILVVAGPAVAGPALLLGLADHVIMIDGAYAFVSGPAMVEQFTGVPIDRHELGGASIHGSRSGAATAVVGDAETANDLIAEILSYLPSHCDELPTPLPFHDPVDREVPELRDIVPTAATGSYDVRDVLSAVLDDEAVTELHGDWAGNMVTALGSVGGHPVGVVANQPQNLAGTLDIAASQKGARFVSLCDAFNLPLLTFVDTPGFQPGKDLEWRGMIRHGAQLAFAYARATVPRISVTLRKSYGGAYIVMDSKYMGNDLAMAWPSSEIAVMGAKGAIEILHRKADADERVELEADYEERLLNPYMAAERGSIDMVIDPAETRRHVASALDLLHTKRESLQQRRHDNLPL